MCDFNRISGLIIGAQVSYLLSLGIVAAAVGLGSNPFTSAANIPAMVIASAAALTAAGLIAGAIAELDKCAGGPCAPALGTLRTNLIALAASIGGYGVSLAGLAIVAGVPFVGSAAAAGLLIWAVSLTTLFSAVAMGYLGNAIQAFNTCLRQTAPGSNNDGATTAIVGLGIVIIIVTLVVNATGVATGAIPIQGPVRITG